jgi:hypothetical protein
MKIQAQRKELKKGMGITDDLTLVERCPKGDSLIRHHDALDLKSAGPLV